MIDKATIKKEIKRLQQARELLIDNDVNGAKINATYTAIYALNWVLYGGPPFSVGYPESADGEER